MPHLPFQARSAVRHHKWRATLKTLTQVVGTGRMYNHSNQESEDLHRNKWVALLAAGPAEEGALCCTNDRTPISPDLLRQGARLTGTWISLHHVVSRTRTEHNGHLALHCHPWKVYSIIGGEMVLQHGTLVSWGMLCWRLRIIASCSARVSPQRLERVKLNLPHARPLHPWSLL